LGVSLEFVAVFAAVGYSAYCAAYLTNTIRSLLLPIKTDWCYPVFSFWLTFEFNDFIVTPFHPQAFAAIVKLAIFASTLAFMLFTYSVRNLGLNEPIRLSMLYQSLSPSCLPAFRRPIEFHQMVVLP
jgi:drug/metabolite transporter (DMT)-like permease